jgi:putative DNA primase/helicase
MNDPINQFKEAMYSAGMTPPDFIEADGKLRRFASGDKKNDKNGWYVFHNEGIPAGAFGDWSKDISQSWKANIGRALTPSEIRAHQIKMEAVKEQREVEKLSLQAEAKEKAIGLWAKAIPAIDHPYVMVKQIKPYTAKQFADSLLIPVYEDGEIQSLQIIQADGSKRFLTGGKVAGCYYAIGKIENAKALCICEGFATGATIHEATGYPVAIAFNASNLQAVAKNIKAKYPQLKLIVCGDDDYKTEGNPGVTKATETAQAVNGLVAIPSFGMHRKEKATDFNDMAQEAGLQAVKEVIQNALQPIQTQWHDPIPLPDMPPVQAFDLALMPDSLRAWIKDIAELMQSPTDFPAISAIVALSSLIGAKAVIQPKQKTDWQIRPNLWGGLIGRASSKKSPSLDEVLEPLFKLEAKENERVKTEYEQWVIDCQVAELDKQDKEKKAKAEIANGNNSQARTLLEGITTPPEPIRRRFVVNDSTVEKLGEILAVNPWGILCYQDELIGLLKGMDKTGQEGARAFYLQGYNGNQPYTFDRIGRGRIHIPRVCIALLGGIQPGKLQEYIRGAVSGGSADDGLLQRFGLAVYPDTGKDFVFIDRYPDIEAKDKAKQVFNRLAELQPEGDNPTIWRFTPQAQELFNEWFIDLNKELQSGELHPALESHFQKYTKHIPALALIFAHIDTPDSGNLVGERELARALAWGEYLRTHAIRIYQSAIQPETTGAKTILKKIKAKVLIDGFTAREVAQRQWAGLSDVEAVKKALALLTDYEYINPQTSPTSPKGGRPSEKYSINPKLLDGGLNE